MRGCVFVNIVFAYTLVVFFYFSCIDMHRGLCGLSFYVFLLLRCSFRKLHLGSHLAEFMWRRRCKILGSHPFHQILQDIGVVYDSKAWTSLAEEFNTGARTERQNRRRMKQAIDLVLNCFIGQIGNDFQPWRICHFHFFYFFSQRTADSPDFVNQDGLISLGESTFLSVSETVTRKKVCLLVCLSVCVPACLYACVVVLLLACWSLSLSTCLAGQGDY